MSQFQMVCIGASAGGIQALQSILSGLGKTFHIPVAVVQHLPERTEADLAMVLQPHFHGKVVEILDKMPIEKGHCYLAPPGYHVLVEKDHTFSLSQDEFVNFSRPSIDVLLESAAEVYDIHLCGIVLTGANHDGAEGLKCVQERGGLAIVQNPDDAEYSTMPLECLRRFHPREILGLNEIATFLDRLR